MFYDCLKIRRVKHTAMLLLPVLGAVVILLSGCFQANKSIQISQQPAGHIVLYSWQYCEGSVITDLSSWKEINSPNEITRSISGKPVWFKTMLPEWKEGSPALYIGQVDHFMQVFLNSRIIYQIGNDSAKFTGRNQNLMSLPYFQKGDTLMIRIQAVNNAVGFRGKVLLGTAYEILREVYSINSFRLLFAFTFLISGTFCLIAYFRTRISKLLSGIALFLISMAAFIFSNSLLIQLMFPSPQLYSHLNFISLALTNIGGFVCIEYMVTGRYKRIIRYLTLLTIVFLIAGIILNDFTEIKYLDVLPYLLLLFAVDMICSIIIFILIRTKQYRFRVMTAGLMGFFLFASLEIILYFMHGMYGDFGYNIRSIYIGVACFAGSLLWVVIHEYFETYKQKEMLHRKELEAIKREKQIQQQFSARLIESQENERNRIALEMHDSLGHKLLLIKNLLLEKINSNQYSKFSVSKKQPPDVEESDVLLRKVIGLTGESIREIREITWNLRPQHLDQLGLTTAIETLIEKAEASTEIRFHKSIHNIDNLIGREKEINLFRIMQESISNIIKHSRASDAFVNIISHSDKVCIQIRDNGIGRKSAAQNLEDVSESQTAGNNGVGNNGMGIIGMKERAAMIGANLDVRFSETDGTTVSLEYKL